MGLFSFFRRKDQKDKPAGGTASQNDHPTETKQSDKSGLASEFKMEHKPSGGPVVAPVEDRIKTMKANEAGLYPHEVLLLSYAPRYCTTGNAYPGFWWYHYGVKDLDAKLRSLLERGFLEVGSLRAALERETVAGLKELLKANQLKVSGKKAELLQRLLDGVPEEELKKRLTEYGYALTGRVKRF